MSSTAESIRTEQPQPQTSAGQLERLPRTRDTIVVQSNIPTLDTAMFEHMQRIATMMAQSSLVPAHLNVERKEGNQVVQLSSKEAIANCFLVVNQAIRWNMDPFAVAQHAYTTKGRLGWEGKMIAAVINTHQMIEERLSYAYSGTGDQRKVVVTAKIRGDKEPRSVEGTVASWRTTGTNSPWDKQSQWDQQLSYRGAREWARRHLPEAILGVWGDDEIQQFEATERTLAGEQHHDRPTRGPDGLRAAMGSTDTTDATVVSETKKGEPTRAGTPPAAGATNAARPGRHDAPRAPAHHVRRALVAR